MKLATAADERTVVALTAEAYRPYTELFGYPPIPVTEEYAPRIARSEVWLRDVDGTISGLIVVERHADHLMLFSIAVSPSTQRGGQGRAMLAWLEEKALEWNAAEIRLYTNARMERNIAIYRTFGYAETGRRPNPYRLGWTIVDMAKRIATQRIAGGEEWNMTKSGTIRCGIGGWTFDPWEGSFYPEKLAKKRQLEYASSQLKVIEVNGTYYGSQKPETFAKWASKVPDDFIFSLKASRFTTNRKVLAEAGESIGKFLTQGLTELGPHLGPILWQFAPTKKFEHDDFAAFLKLLPEKQDGLKLQHVVEVRNSSFQVPEFVALLAKHKVAVVCADHADYPMISDVTADFVYVRLQTGSDEVHTCYDEERLDLWAGRLKDWASGGIPAEPEAVDPSRKPAKTQRDVFAFFITEGKVNAPNGARELQQRVS